MLDVEIPLFLLDVEQVLNPCRWILREVELGILGEFLVSFGLNLVLSGLESSLAVVFLLLGQKGPQLGLGFILGFQ